LRILVCPVRVNSDKTHFEHNESAVALIADMRADIDFGRSSGSLDIDLECDRCDYEFLEKFFDVKPSPLRAWWPTKAPHARAALRALQVGAGTEDGAGPQPQNSHLRSGDPKYALLKKYPRPL